MGWNAVLTPKEYSFISKDFWHQKTYFIWNILQAIWKSDNAKKYTHEKHIHILDEKPNSNYQSQ